MIAELTPVVWLPFPSTGEFACKNVLTDGGNIRTLKSPDIMLQQSPWDNLQPQHYDDAIKNYL